MPEKILTSWKHLSEFIYKVVVFFVSGSDLAGSPPSTPSTGGLGAPPNAFMFPVNPSNSSNQLLESKFGGGGGVGRGREVDQQVTLENHGLLGELKRCIEESCQGQNTLQFPPSLLQEIASHVIQEASLEPCGLKGKPKCQNFQSPATTLW